MDVSVSHPSDACSISSGTPKDRIVRNSYSNFDDVVAVESGVGTSLSQTTQTFAFNTDGYLDYVTDAESNRTGYQYDDFGRREKTFYPHTTIKNSWSSTDYEQIVYDDFGRSDQVRQRDGSYYIYSYDNHGQVDSIDAPGSDPTVFLEYNYVGKATKIWKTGHVLDYDYNSVGQLVSETSPQGVVSYEYDAEGRRSRMDYPGPGGFFVTYEYSFADELERIKEKGSSTNVLAIFQYDDRGRRTTLERGNGVVTTYGFDATGDANTLIHDLDGTSSDLTLSFDYNVAGQITSRTSSNSSYDFDSYAAITENYSSSGLNQYTSIGGVTQSYDALKNLSGDGSSSYTFDSANRLKSVTPSLSLDYDPLGRLHLQTVSSVSTTFLYDGVNLIAEYSGSTVSKRYVHGPRTDEPLVEYTGSGTGSKTYYIADERGSIVAGTNGVSGGRVFTNKYDDFGKSASGNQGLFQYTGQVYLESTGLYHFKARAYDPSTGRFLQTDPIGYTAGMNLYAYVGSDPINNRDPRGLDHALPPPEEGRPRKPWSEYFPIVPIFSGHLTGAGYVTLEREGLPGLDVSSIPSSAIGTGSMLASATGVLDWDDVLPDRNTGLGSRLLKGIRGAGLAFSVVTSITGSTPQFQTFYHGTDLESGLALLYGAPLSVDLATELHIDGPIAFHLADDYGAATYAAIRRREPVVLTYSIRNYAVNRLISSGAYIQPIPIGGGAALPGNEFVIPPSSFGLFDTLRRRGHIRVTTTPLQ